MRALTLTAAVALQLTITLPRVMAPNPNRPTPEQAIAVLLADRHLLWSDRANWPSAPAPVPTTGPWMFVLGGDAREGPYGPFPPIPYTRPLNCCAFYSFNSRTGRTVVK